jgi:hypothetical protein
MNYEEFQPAYQCCRYGNPTNWRVDFENSWLIESSYKTLMANQKQSSEQINKVNVIKSYLVDEVWTLQ